MLRYSRALIGALLLVLVPPSTATSQGLFSGAVAPATASFAQAHVVEAVASVTYRPEETVYETALAGAWLPQRRVRNEFLQGLPYQQFEDEWQGDLNGSWANQQRTQYAYTGTTLTAEMIFDWSFGTWVPRERTRYVLGGAPYEQVILEYYENGVWVPQERARYTHADGYVTGGVSETWDGNAWVNVDRFSLVEIGGEAVETLESWNGQGWEPLQRIVYTGQDIPRLYATFEQFLQEFGDYEGMLYSLRFPDLVQQSWDGVAWVDESATTTERKYQSPYFYVYEELVTTSFWQDGAWVPVQQLEVDYGQLSGSTSVPSRAAFRLHDGQEWTDYFVEQYGTRNDIGGRIAQAVVWAETGAGLQETSRIRIKWTAVPSVGVEDEVPATFTLHQNHPNPFNPATTIRFDLAAAQPVRLAVYDLLGRQVALLAEGTLTAGTHELVWDAATAPSGVYLYRLETPTHATSRLMTLVK